MSTPLPDIHDTILPGRNAVTGLVLAGGRGARMGAIDKGLQLLHGTPLAVHAMQRISGQVGEVIFSANRNLAAYAAFGAPVVSDATEGFQGPLAGLLSGLMHCRTPYLVSVPCDAPFFPLDLVQRLMKALLREQVDLAIAVTGGGESEQSHPVFCLARTSLLPYLSAFLQQGERKVERWTASLGAARVCFEDEQAFGNINSMAVLERFESTEKPFMIAGLHRDL